MKTRTAVVALTLLSAIAADASAAPKKRVASNKAKKAATTAPAASAGPAKPLLDCAKTENQKADLCARPVWIKDKAIGSGPHVTGLSALGATFTGGTVEGNALYVGVANGDAGAVLSVDLTTGNSNILSQ